VPHPNSLLCLHALSSFQRTGFRISSTGCAAQRRAALSPLRFPTEQPFELF
jgi:hypothetical protein